MEPLTFAVLAAGVGMSKLLDSSKDRLLDSIERQLERMEQAEGRLVASIKLSANSKDLAQAGDIPQE